MITDVNVAAYFLSCDTDRKLFGNALMQKNGRTFYEGNARLNKYLQLAQNIYIAKTGKPLFETQFYAYDNGVVSKTVLENYQRLIKIKPAHGITEQSVLDFLHKIYVIFSEASVEELIELSHEDPQWQKRHGFARLEDEKINSMESAEEYKEQYADIVTYMDRMQI